MRFLIPFLIVTVLVAIAYSSPVPETAAVAQGGKGVRVGLDGIPRGPNGRALKKGGNGARRLKAGRRGPQGGKGGPLRGRLQAGKGPKKVLVRRRKPAA